MRTDGTQGFSRPGDEVIDDKSGIKYKLVPRKGYGYNQWVPVNKAGTSGITGPIQIAQMSPKTEAEIDAMLLRGLERGDYGSGPQIQKQIDSLRRNQRNRTPGGIPRASGRRNTVVAQHEPTGELLTESRKRILRDIKKPVEVKESPTKFKVKPTGRKNKTVGQDMMKTPDTPQQYKPPVKVWSKKDYASNVRESQERKNEVLELVGASEHHWSYLTEDSRKKKQEKVNEMMAAEFDKQMEVLYEKHQNKENKTNKVRNYLSDSKLVYDKLDPQSAESMPSTGNPTVDANVKKATNKKEKSRKLKTLLGKRG